MNYRSPLAALALAVVSTFTMATTNAFAETPSPSATATPTRLSSPDRMPSVALASPSAAAGLPVPGNVRFFLLGAVARLEWDKYPGAESFVIELVEQPDMGVAVVTRKEVPASFTSFQTDFVPRCADATYLYRLAVVKGVRQSDFVEFKSGLGCLAGPENPDVAHRTLPSSGRGHGSDRPDASKLLVLALAALFAGLVCACWARWVNPPG